MKFDMNILNIYNNNIKKYRFLSHVKVEKNKL